MVEYGYRLESMGVILLSYLGPFAEKTETACPDNAHLFPM